MTLRERIAAARLENLEALQSLTDEAYASGDTETAHVYAASYHRLANLHLQATGDEPRPEY
jgi:hypothetical protein